MALKLWYLLPFPVASMKILFFKPKILKTVQMLSIYHILSQHISHQNCYKLQHCEKHPSLVKAYKKNWLTRLNGFFQDVSAGFFLITGEKIQLVQQLFCLQNSIVVI